jgi:hypothetical protein
MITSAETGQLVTALIVASGLFDPIVKGSTGQAGSMKTKYADLAAVIAATRPALLANGLVIIQSPTTGEPGCVALTTRLAHRSGEYMQDTASVALNRPDPQSYGSTITYLKRYSWLAILGLPTLDDDGHAATQASRSDQSKADRLAAIKAAIGELQADQRQAVVDAIRATGLVSLDSSTHTAARLTRAESIVRQAGIKPAG